MSVIILASLSLGFIAYLSIGAWTYGYVRSMYANTQYDEHKVGIVAGIVFPLFWIGYALNSLFAKFVSAGLKAQQKKLDKKKQRIAAEEKVRIELLEAEKELEEQFKEIEQQEIKQKQMQEVPKLYLKEWARQLDSHLYADYYRRKRL